MGPPVVVARIIISYDIESLQGNMRAAEVSFILPVLLLGKYPFLWIGCNR